MERVWPGIVFPADRFNDSVGERLGGVRLDGRCATPTAEKLVLTGERHYTRNDDIGSDPGIG
ncbi:hypothetical protein ACNKHV_00585 [Shigella flexneri]